MKAISNKCNTCNVVFPSHMAYQKKTRHLQLCRQATLGRCDVPSVPTSLLEAYHGGGPDDDRNNDLAGGDDAVCDDAVDLP